MIKYSLIIPCFNEAKNLPKLIKKCQALTHKRDIEVIIVNNSNIIMYYHLLIHALQFFAEPIATWLAAAERSSSPGASLFLLMFYLNI